MKIEKAKTALLIIGYFVGFEKYGIDVFYNRKYQMWLFDNSTDKDSLHPEFDANGFILNAKFTAFHNSIPLTENDFIDIQIKHLNTFLDLKDLKSMDLLQIQHFKKYLENRIKAITPEPLDLPKITKTNGISIEAFTNETYYDILEKCTIEAFECLELKDLYPKDGSKAIWDVSSLTITNGNGLTDDKDNELYKKLYIKDNMRVTFLLAIERYSEEFQNKYSITRSVFYKKCYQSLLVKKSQSSLWKTPDLGIDINNPDILTFVWNMRGDIEARSVEPQQNTYIDKYIKSFDVTYFGESADKRNPDGSKNDFYTGETFTTWLHNSDLRVRQYKDPLIQKKDDLINFNHVLHTLVNDTIRLYKQIRLYDNSLGETGIYLAQKAVLKTLSQIEFYSKKIKHCVLDGMQDCAILFKIYCVEKFEEIIFNIEDILFIRVYDSPLKEDFKKVAEALKNSIVIEELKIISEFKEPLQAEAEPEPLYLSDSTQVEKEIIVIKEPHGEMFSNNGFQLFEHILDEYVKQKNTTGRYEDLSYYYRCLFEDKFIHQKPEPFRLWFIEKYSDEFSKIKTKLQTTSPQRKKDYSTALEWFKRQNK